MSLQNGSREGLAIPVRVTPHRAAFPARLDYDHEAGYRQVEPVTERNIMTIGTLLLVLLVLMLVGALPTWPHSRNWGFYPSGGLGLLLVILVVLLLAGVI
jgi:hypothetical protein